MQTFFMSLQRVLYQIFMSLGEKCHVFVTYCIDSGGTFPTILIAPTKEIS